MMSQRPQAPTMYWQAPVRHFSGSRKRGVEFKGDGRHEGNRHDRRNRHGCLIVLHFVGRAEGGRGALQKHQTVKIAKTVIGATLTPPCPTS